MEEYKNTYTKDRLDLKNTVAKLKDGTLSLDSLSLSAKKSPQK